MTDNPTLFAVILVLLVLGLAWAVFTLGRADARGPAVAWRYRFRSPIGIPGQWQYTPDEKWALELAENDQFEVETLYL